MQLVKAAYEHWLLYTLNLDVPHEQKAGSVGAFILHRHH